MPIQGCYGCLSQGRWVKRGFGWLAGSDVDLINTKRNYRTHVFPEEWLNKTKLHQEAVRTKKWCYRTINKRVLDWCFKAGCSHFTVLLFRDICSDWGKQVGRWLKTSLFQYVKASCGWFQGFKLEIVFVNIMKVIIISHIHNQSWQAEDVRTFLIWRWKWNILLRLLLLY